MMNGPSTASTNSTNNKEGLGGDSASSFTGDPPQTGTATAASAATATANSTTPAAAAVIQQEPVNFHGNNAAGDVFSRRVTLGGGHSGAASNAVGMNMNMNLMDRRGSMGSWGMDDVLFGKRLSMGFGGPAAGVSNFPTDATAAAAAALRRGSMDSTGAALDAAILDLTRRRLSMGGNAMDPTAMNNNLPGNNNINISNNNNNNNNNMNVNSNNSALDNLLAAGNIEAALAQRRSSLDMIGASAQASTNALLQAGMDPSAAAGAGMAHDMTSFLQQQQQQQQNQPSMLLNQMGSAAAANNPSMFPPAIQNPSAIAARQQQLQAQQRELERRQRELEQQRRELIASMQQRKQLMMQQQAGGNTANNTTTNNNSMTSNPQGGGFFGGGMGNLDSMQAAAQPSSMLPEEYMVNAIGTGTANNPNVNNNVNSGVKQQWWICQICNKQAFSSHEEALSHEAVCVMANGNNNFAMGQQFAQQQMRTMNNNANSRASVSGGKSVKSTGKRGDASVRTSSTGQSYEPVFSKGPFTKLPHPMPLSMSTDKDWLTPLHCFVRQHCVEIFSASENDVATPSKGKRKPIQVGQIGIRCPHCHSDTSRERGSVYYPTTISSIYNATMNLLQRHLHSCNAVPRDIMEKYETLKSDDARSGTSKRYWIKSALSLGLVDTAEMGIRYSTANPPPLPQLTDSQRDIQSANDEQTLASSGADSQSVKVNLTEEHDKAYSTAFSYELLSQMKPCLFTEADRLGKRKGLPPGFPGLACKHCFGGYGSGRFFPSSIKTLSDTSKTLNVLHNHMIRCRKCPPDIRERLEYLRATHDDERSKMKFGSQKAFFARIWERLHGTKKTSNEPTKRKSEATSPHPQPKKRKIAEDASKDGESKSEAKSTS